MTELLAASSLDDDQRNMVSVIERSTRSLIRIANGILSFSQVEKGEIEFDVIRFDLREAVETCARPFATQAQLRNLTFVVTFDARLPQWASGDPVHVRQTLTNLLSNALKFTETGGIWLEVSLGGDPAERLAVLFRIIDTRIGMDAEARARLFTPFSQGDSGTTRKYEGIGLGLAIVQRLVMRMNGSIGVESELR